MNTKKTLLFLATALMLLVSSACGPAAETEAPTQEGAQLTAVFETAQAAVAGTLTQMALSNPSDTPVPFLTETPFQTGTALPLPTSNKAMISVSKETNCRLGPDVVYEKVGLLAPGIMTEVFALDPTRGYYFIENPGQRGTYCWVWGFYATQVNDFTGMPIYTPAHTPIAANTSTPTFTPTGTLNTPTGTLNTPTTKPTTPVYKCSFVSIIPKDHDKFKVGETQYDLIWVVKNDGLTTWKQGTVFYQFKSGTNMHNNLTKSDLTKDIAPKEESTLLLDLIVPATPKEYTETWDLVDGTTILCSITIIIEAIP